MPLDSTEELDFARAMLADPHDADRRLFYADWLEEQGDVERAALVMRAERWPVEFSEPDYRECDLGRSRNRFSFSVPSFSIVTHLSRADQIGCIAVIYQWEQAAMLADSLRADQDGYRTFRIRPDGSSPDHPDNWAWLLALAVGRGLIVPALGTAPTTPEAHHASRLD